MPEADKIVPLVAQAGSRGMARGEIGRVIELDREVLDELLAALVSVGLLTASVEDGYQVFRAGVGGKVAPEW